MRLLAGVELLPSGELIRSEKSFDLLFGLLADLLDFLALFRAGERVVVASGLDLGGLGLADALDFLALVFGEVQAHLTIGISGVS